jgi:agmatine deiminase
VPDPITDGHVDGICVFVRPGAVLLQTVEDESDPNHEICEQARAAIEATTDAAGRKIEIIGMPLLPEYSSYVNFYVANGGVVVPLAGEDTMDSKALEIIGQAFPGRAVVGVSGIALAAGGGGVHCITQQVPVP